MKKILIAVDDTKGSKKTFSISERLCKSLNPESIILVYVERYEGRSLMDEMLGDAEMSTLKEMLEGTEYKEALDNKANEILDFYKNELESHGLKGVKTIIKGGHPVDEILKAAEEEGADMIVIGSTGHRPSDVLIGSVSREIVYKSDIPVLVAKA